MTDKQTNSLTPYTGVSRFFLTVKFTTSLLGLLAGGLVEEWIKILNLIQFFFDEFRISVHVDRFFAINRIDATSRCVTTEWTSFARTMPENLNFIQGSYKTNWATEWTSFARTMPKNLNFIQESYKTTERTSFVRTMPENLKYIVGIWKANIWIANLSEWQTFTCSVFICLLID